MALTSTDRRRFFLATTFTLLALPALWWVNRSESSAAPKVAVAGADVGVDVGVEDGADNAAAEIAAAEAAVVEGTADEPADAAELAAVDAAATTSAAPVPPAPDEPGPGEVAPVYLDGPSSQIGAGLSEIAVPARPDTDRVTTTATFRNTFAAANGCAIPGVVNGRTVTIVNLDNSRSVTCVTVVTVGALSEQVVLHTSLFAQLADLTDAPIPVEIRR